MGLRACGRRQAQSINPAILGSGPWREFRFAEPAEIWGAPWESRRGACQGFSRMRSEGFGFVSGGMAFLLGGGIQHVSSMSPRECGVVVSRHVTSRHVTARHGTARLRHVTSRRVMSRRVISCRWQESLLPLTFVVDKSACHVRSCRVHVTQGLSLPICW